MDIIDSALPVLGALVISGVYAAFPVVSHGRGPRTSLWIEQRGDMQMCSSLSASGTLWSSPNPPFKSERRHLYPILVSFSHPQTWLWNMLTCLIMECSLRPCWMLHDVFYTSHILFYIYLSMCMHMYVHLYALCTCTFVLECGGEGSASISDPLVF